MISESAALLYTAGIAQDLPTSVLSHVKEPGATMTVQLYLYATEGGHRNGCRTPWQPC